MKLLWNTLQLRSPKAVLRGTGILLRGFKTYLVRVDLLSWRHGHWVILTSYQLRLKKLNLSFRTLSKGWKDPDSSTLVHNVKVIVFIVLVVQVLNKSTRIQSLRTIVIIQVMIHIMSVFWRADYSVQAYLLLSPWKCLTSYSQVLIRYLNNLTSVLLGSQSILKFDLGTSRMWIFGRG